MAKLLHFYWVPCGSIGHKKMQIINLKIIGMSCSACVTHITNALQSVPGVKGTVVDSKEKYAKIEGENLDLAQLQAALEKEGYQAQPV